MQVSIFLSRMVTFCWIGVALFTHSALAVLPLDPDNPGATEAERYAQMMNTFQFWGELDQSLDRSQFDPAALGRQLQTPETALEWVLDQTRPLDYPGLLRGAEGVLQDRHGNTLDRTLLLAAILQGQGHAVRLVRTDPASLPAQDASSLPQDPWQALNLDQISETAEQVLRRVFPDQSIERESGDWLTRENADNREWQARAEQIATSLGQITGLELMAAAQPNSNKADDQAGWAVEYETESGWQALSLASGRIEKAAAGADRFGALNELPRELLHRLHIEVVALTRQGENLERSVLVDSKLAVSDLTLPLVSIQFLPALGTGNQMLLDALADPDPISQIISSLEEVRTWVPAIRFDGETIMDKGIQPDGTVVDDPFQPPTARAFRDAAGMLGGLRMGGQPREEAAASEWLGATIELTYHRPDGHEQRFSRTLFNRHDSFFSKATEERVGAPAEFQHFGAIARESHFFLQTSQLSPFWFIDHMINHVSARRGPFEELARFPSLDFRPLIDQFAEPIPEPLVEFLLQRFRYIDYRPSVALSEIGIVALHRGKWPRSRAELAFEETLDVVHSGLTRTGQDQSLPPGVADSVAEWRVFDQGNGTSAGAGAFLNRLQDEVDGWLVLTSASDWNAAMEDTSPPALFEESWRQGRWVVAHEAEAGSALPIGAYWWDLDPSIGDALVRDLMGHGSASRIISSASFGLCLATQSPLTQYATTLTVIGFWGGLVWCMAESMNFGCCLLGGGVMAALGAAVGAVWGLRVGIAFDLINAPISPAPVLEWRCPDLLERERQQQRPST